MLGVSRKRFISVISKDSEPKDRLGGTIATIIYSLMQGIQVHRVHDVKETKQAIQTFEKLNEKLKKFFLVLMVSEENLVMFP